MPGWPSWLGRQTHRVLVKVVEETPGISEGRGLESRPRHLYGVVDMVIKREMTKKFIEEAFGGESMAHMRYLLFEAVAEKEGFPNIANMFRAIAFAEIVHARNHYRSLGEIKGTTDNLQICIDGEHYEVNEMYPAFNDVAKIQDEKEAERDTYYALEAEKTHEILYKKAKELAEQRKDIDEKRFSICPICGHTVVGKPPERCPICGASNDKFLIFE